MEWWVPLHTEQNSGRLGQEGTPGVYGQTALPRLSCRGRRGVRVWSPASFFVSSAHSPTTQPTVTTSWKTWGGRTATKHWQNTTPTHFFNFKQLKMKNTWISPKASLADRQPGSPWTHPLAEWNTESAAVQMKVNLPLVDEITSGYRVISATQSIQQIFIEHNIRWARVREWGYKEDYMFMYILPHSKRYLSLMDLNTVSVSIQKTKT